MTYDQEGHDGAIQEFRSLLTQPGFEVPPIYVDGAIHRFGKKKSAWYTLQDDGAAVFGSYGDGAITMTRPVGIIASMRTGRRTVRNRKKRQASNANRAGSPTCNIRRMRMSKHEHVRKHFGMPLKKARAITLTYNAKMWVHTA
jgi:hypothetical protein